MSVKEQVLQAIYRLPDDVDFQDITGELMLLAKAQKTQENLSEAAQHPEALCAIDLVKHLCGSLEGGPSDLATNPEHLRGFGE